ncbi:hypothetical protein H8S33_00900 [Ornithinibacillus sp. BX22]|uniref:Uncharacterized protein n=1 Tax=Ornithinibacillus hominis TaxID=2763055 RepID=A0A923L2Q0_9BACI|nr:hypothetical protein [Ornithinibacillus hominis]MBC5635370.1 hypothetical protein [Ornithinibacillus hominis]
MSKKRYIAYFVSGFIIGIFILPAFLEWLGFTYSFADVLELIFGEPNLFNRIIVGLLLVIFLIWIGRGLYKGYKRLT